MRILDRLLIQAIDANSQFLVKKLIASGANVNASDWFGETPLFNAVSSSAKSLEIVKLLIENGADAYRINNYGETLLFKAAFTNKNIVELLIEKGLYINHANNNGKTAIFNAVTLRDTAITKLLIEKGANLNKTDIDGKTPLHEAIRFENIEAIKLLIDQGANVTIADKSGRTPLLMATCMRGTSRDIIQSLIAKGADVNQADIRGETPLHMALHNGHKDIVELLIKHGADVNKTNIEGETPLYIAAKKGNIALIQLLIKKEIVINDSTIKQFETLPFDKKFLLAETLIKSENVKLLAMAILILGKEPLIKTPEKDSHDISFATKELQGLKNYFQEMQINTPSYTSASTTIHDLIVKRIMDDKDSTDAFKAFVKSHKGQSNVDKDKLKKYIILDNANHRAYEWLMTYNYSMMFINDRKYKDTLRLIENMLSHIVACIDDLKKNGRDKDAADIENALILQLDNAMKANEGTMSCVPGTPRFLRVVIEAYKNLVIPDYNHKDKIEKAVNYVVNNVLLNSFNNTINNNHSKNTSDIIDKLIENCEALATLGLDTAKNVIYGVDKVESADDAVTGRLNGEPFDENSLKLRTKLMYSAYSNYKSFEASVLENAQLIPQKLSNEHIEYLHLMYIAITNKDIRDKMYENLDSQIKTLRRKEQLQNAPQKIIDAIKNNTPENKIKKLLDNTLSLLIFEDRDLEASNQAIKHTINIIDKIKKLPSYEIKLDDGEKVIELLKQEYRDKNTKSKPNI